MKIKTFCARTIAEALRSAKGEFGHDALILSTKETPVRAASWFGGRTRAEVVAAIDTAPESEHDLFAPSRDFAAQTGFAEPALHGRNGIPRIDEDYSEMRRALYSLTRASGPPAPRLSDAAAYEIYQDLVANEVSESLACKLLDEAQTAVAPEARGQRPALAKAVTDAALRLIRTAGTCEGLPARKAVAFVGPTGVGKTTAAAKLAARLALEKKKKVMLITTDTHRIGAVEQLKTYAGLMGLPFRIATQPSELQRAILEQSQRDYILIDTTGCSQRDLAPVQDLMKFFQESTGIERHLVLSANTKPLDMQEIIDRFGICDPDHLLFTKLDETSTFGPIFNELVRTQKPLSYVADGQRVPEDLHALSGDQIVDIVLNAH